LRGIARAEEKAMLPEYLYDLGSLALCAALWALFSHALFLGLMWRDRYRCGHTNMPSGHCAVFCTVSGLAAVWFTLHTYYLSVETLIACIGWTVLALALALARSLKWVARYGSY
jgi:hypothetical protein